MADYSDLIQAAGQRWNVDPALLGSLVHQESGGNASAFNASGGGQGATGLTQVRGPALQDYNKANGTKYSTADLKDPAKSIDVGAWYLGQQLDKFNDPAKALIAYNEGAGSPNVQKGSTAYSQSVLGRLNMPQKKASAVDKLLGISQQPQSQQVDPFAGISGAPAAQASSGDVDPFAGLDQPQAAQPQQAKPSAPQQAQQPGGVMSFLAGVGRGVQETALGAQQLIGHGLQAAGADTAGNWLVNDANAGLQRGAQEVSPYQQAHPTATGVGQFAGNVAATAPIGGVFGAGKTLSQMALRGAASGALGGAVATPVDPNSQDYWGDKAQQVALGAATGGVAGPAFGMLGRAISPNVSPDVQTLINKGVTPTPGQILGGGFQRTEDKLTSVPVLGDLIKGAQGRAINQFNVAAYNDALAPIGQTFDSKAAKVGQEGISQVKGKIQDVYNSVLPKMQFQADPQFQQEVTQLGGMVQSLPEAQQKTFMKVLQNQVGKMGPQGNMDGQTLKGVSEELGDKASGYLGDGSFDNRQLGAAISALKTSFMDAVKRSSDPELAQQLKNADTAWANYARIRAAGASIGAANNEGVFTAAQLQNAVKSGDKSAGKGAFATGNALMQDLSGAGQRVLGSKYPDSGTAGRGLMALLAPGGVAAGLATAPGSTLATLGGIGLGSLPYTSAGQRGVAALLTARPQFAAPVSNAVKGLAPWVIPGGTAALLSR